MQPLVLYCKTFRRDIELTARLIESINQFNVDKIQTYISVPKSDIHLFRERNFENIVLYINIMLFILIIFLRI